MSRQILAGRVAHLGTTVFSEFSALALKHGAMNLGQGFPDFDGPEAGKEAARKAITDGVNQYAPSPGLRDLRVAEVVPAWATLTSHVRSRCRLAFPASFPANGRRPEAPPRSRPQALASTRSGGATAGESSWWNSSRRRATT